VTGKALGMTKSRPQVDQGDDSLQITLSFRSFRTLQGFSQRANVTLAVLGAAFLDAVQARLWVQDSGTSPPVIAVKLKQCLKLSMI